MSRTRATVLFALAALLATGAALTPDAARGDDRKLFVGFREVPYVFILLDNSASMNWSSKCTQEWIDQGFCGPLLCPDGGCMPDLAGDDPNSKLYQAKDVLYEVLFEVEDVDFGFATYNQDDIYIRSKHWMYRATSTGPELGSTGVFYPAIGDKDVFGRTWPCVSGDSSIEDVGCAAGNDAADLSDPFEARRVQRLSKGGEAWDETVDFFVTPGGGGAPDFKVTYGVPSGAPGDTTITVPVMTCTVNNAGVCTDTPQGADVTFDLTNEFLFMDVEEDFGMSMGTRGENNGDLENFFGLDDSTDMPMLEGSAFSCNGLDMNDDTALDSRFIDPDPSDGDDTYNLRWPTVASPRADDVNNVLESGDFIPFYWADDHKSRILARLAPNRLLGEPVPDFTVSRYFEDVEDPAVSAHRLKNELVRPILASSASPLNEAIRDFRKWYDGCEHNPNCATADDGFEEYAATRDPNWPCRKKYLLIISDGDESCGGGNVPCSATANMQAQLGLETLVIGYGVDPDGGGAGGGNILTCLPANSSNLDAVFPQNRAELLAQLTTFFDAITGRTATFSAAAVPSVQAESADKLYLSSLSPVAENSTWPSRVDAYLKPLPVDDQNRPDFTEACPDPSVDSSACHLWNAAEVVRDNQSTPANPVGPGQSQRRIYYSQFPDDEARPLRREFFAASANRPGGITLDEEYDFWTALDVPFVEGFSDPSDPPAAGSEEAARDEADDIVAVTMALKTGTLPDDSTVDYVLGDVFHSDPSFINAPGNNLYFLADAGGEDDLRDCDAGNQGYRCFFFKHQRRRKMLGAGHNDGMYHFYEAGIFQTAGDFADNFDNGSGTELFAYMPRPVMPTVRRLTRLPVQHQFSVDGRGTAADVFIDPLHNLSLGDLPDPDEREWRTVMMGGLRRGGWPLTPGESDLEGPAGTDVQPASGYFVVDITQPDPLVDVSDPDDPFPTFIPTAADPPSCLSAPLNDPDCGTVPFGTAHFEFTDSILGTRDAGDPVLERTVGVRLDEDANGAIDLAPTWSPVNIGRMRVCVANGGSSECNVFADDNTVEDRFVAVFGGGLDATGPLYHDRGNFLYIVDLETGKPIYKRSFDAGLLDPVGKGGAAPSEPAAVDTDFDGYLDTVYIGTTRGFLYRAELQLKVGADLFAPELTPLTVQAQMSDGTLVDEEQMRIQDDAFKPYILFNANDATIDEVILGFDGLGAPISPRQIFFRPSVVFLPELDRYALAIGTGNRENLFDRGDPTGRFFVFLDDVPTADLISGLGMLTPLDLTDIGIDALPFDDDTNFLNSLTRGWKMELAPNQRLVADPFALSGVLFFDTFIPADQAVVLPDSLCREAGTSQIFATLITNGDGLLFTDDSPDATRYVTVEDLVSSPFTEQSQTKNPPPADTSDMQLSVGMQRVQQRLKELFPERCKFPPGYRIDVKTRTTDTGIVFIAPVPICVIEKNYKDF